MVTTRNGPTVKVSPVPVKKIKKSKIKYILNCHIRKEGDKLPYMCPMCLSRILTDNLNLQRCNQCSSLFHNSCWSKWFKTDNPSCPTCRKPYDPNNEEEWDFDRESLVCKV